MSLSNSRHAYSDCYDLMDSALNDDYGVRVRMDDRDSAFYFRMRLHQSRKIKREESTTIFPEDHPMYNATPYDPLVIRIKTDGAGIWVYLEKRKIEPGRIEALSAVDAKLETVVPAQAEPVIVAGRQVEPIRRRV